MGIDIGGVVCSLMWVSFFCHFGNSASDHVSDIGDIAYGLNWYEHPVEMQKYLILIIARSNECVEFSGFQLVACSMEMFGNVYNMQFNSIFYFR